MKLRVIAVGRPGPLLADAIREYEQRAARYWPLDVIEVKQEKAKRGSDDAVKTAESGRIVERVPPGFEMFALTRTGDPLSSSRLASLLERMATRSRPGAAFLIGGALGLADDILRDADRRFRLSTMTLPHDFARLVLAEQLYRAGTIARGEPYHKGER